MSAIRDARDEKDAWEEVASTFAFFAQVANVAPSEESTAMLLEAVRSFAAEEGMDDADAMRHYAQACAERPIEDVVRELAVDWTLLLRGMNQQVRPRPPYAGVWLAEDGIGIETMCAVNASYVEAGLGAGESSTNRHDYFGVQLEFVGLLAERIAEGDREAPLQLASFLDRYLLSWFDSFVAVAREKGKTAFWTGYLGMVASAMKSVRAALPA